MRLRSCPFCGGSGELKKTIIGKSMFHVVCNGDAHCPMIGGMPWRNSRKRAIEDWNTRKSHTCDVQKIVDCLNLEAMHEDAPVYEGDKEGDYYIRLSVVIDVLRSGGLIDGRK